MKVVQVFYAFVMLHFFKIRIWLVFFILNLSVVFFSSLDKRSVKYVKKWTEKLWSHTSQNGLFITVWPGNKNQNAFVGISLNKAKVPMME